MNQVSKESKQENGEGGKNKATGEAKRKQGVVDKNDNEDIEREREARGE